MHARPFLDELERRGRTARCVELASNTIDKARPTWEQEVVNISDRIGQELDDGQDVCLILHSYAGLPGTEAVNRVVQSGGLEARAGKGRLQRVIFFATHTFPAGCVVDPKMFVGPANPSFFVDDDDMAHHESPFEEFFHPDVTREQAQPFVDSIRPAYYIPGGGGIMSEDWKRVPRTIIGTLQDVAIKKAMQEQMWIEFKDEIRWIDTGHSPFVGRPGFIADVVLREIAG